MATLALTALSSLGIGGTAATATAAAGGAAAAGTGATALNILAGVATAASVLGTLSAGSAQASATEQQAAETEIDAGQQQIQSAQRTAALKHELMKVLGENDVAIASAGIDVSGGIASSQRRSAVADASRQISIERGDDDLRRAMLRARAQNLYRQAGQERGGALLKALGQVANFGFGVAQRG